jgi:signal recognition particle subunit SRP19
MNPLQDLMIPQEEMINLPPKMDSSINHFWPLSQTFSMNYKSFVCLWPTYIDSSKTVKEGRRIGKSLGVDQPSVQDISEVLQTINVRHVIQPYKGYPRDTESRWYNEGRVLYDLEQIEERQGGVIDINDSGAAIDVDDVPELTEDGTMTQKDCWKLIASKIEHMPGRKRRLAEEKKQKEEEKKKAREESRKAALTAKASKSSTGGSNKKKGKKKR